MSVEGLGLGGGLEMESEMWYGYVKDCFENGVFEGIGMCWECGLDGWEVSDVKVSFSEGEYYRGVSRGGDLREVRGYVLRVGLEE